MEICGLVSPGRDVVVVDEGAEPDAFWDALGGQGPYTVENVEPPVLKNRLFHCILYASGRMRVEEIKPFKQEDLVDDDVMILDSGREIYVWIGQHADEQERKEGLRMAQVPNKRGEKIASLKLFPVFRFYRNLWRAHLQEEHLFFQKELAIVSPHQASLFNIVLS